jgi:hypothetical protein
VQGARARFLTAIVVLLVTFGAPPAGAQTTAKNELTVFGGLSLIDLTTTAPKSPFILQVDQGLIPLIYPPPIVARAMTFDGGGEFGVRYGRDLTGTLTLTGDFSIVPAHELTEGTRGCPEPIVCIATPVVLGVGFIVPDYFLSQRVVAYHYGGGLRLNLVRAPLTSGTLTPSVIAGIGGVTFSGTNSRESDLAFRIGAGLSASFRNLSAGLEVVDVIVSDHFVTGLVEHDVHLRVTFGVRW